MVACLPASLAKYSGLPLLRCCRLQLRVSGLHHTTPRGRLLAAVCYLRTGRIVCVRARLLHRNDGLGSRRRPWLWDEEVEDEALGCAAEHSIRNQARGRGGELAKQNRRHLVIVCGH